MFLKRLSTGMFSSNSYIVAENGEGIIIDAGVAADELIDVIEKENIKIKYIILTHAHIDHIVSVDELRKRLGAKVLLHFIDARGLTNAVYNSSNLFGLNKTFNEADGFLKDGEVLMVGTLKLEIIHTPGHTSGCVCIKIGNCLFTGDTLFRMSIGRTDLVDGDTGLLMDSIVNKIMKLDDGIVVYPGHGTTTDIGYEKNNNPFI